MAWNGDIFDTMLDRENSMILTAGNLIRAHAHGSMVSFRKAIPWHQRQNQTQQTKQWQQSAQPSTSFDEKNYSVYLKLPLTSPVALKAPDQAAAASTCCSTPPTTPPPPHPFLRPLLPRVPDPPSPMDKAAARARARVQPVLPPSSAGSPPGVRRCAILEAGATATSRPPTRVPPGARNQHRPPPPPLQQKQLHHRTP